MPHLLHRNKEFAGSVFFRGSLPPRAQEFAHLSKQGIAIAPLEPNDAAHWRLHLRHPGWGEAIVVALRDVPMPPHTIIDYDPWLSVDEKDQLRSAGNCITLQVQGTDEFILRQRKHALRFTEALVGNDGLGALDHTSQRFWSPSQLREETAHDADLDIQSLYTVHAVTAEGRLTDGREADDDDAQPTLIWAHTHGLAELGGFDFDVIRPGCDFNLHLCEAMRALAFMIAEGRVKSDEARVTLFEPAADVALIDAATFQRRAPHEESALRDDPGGDHVKNRVVLCEPRTGFLSRLFGKVRASRWLMQPFPDEGLIKFSNDASDLMADRAKKTYSMFRALVEELAEFEFTTIAKLGCRVDGGDESDREHMWFEVHQCEDRRIDATLLNAPFHIERMKQGQRSMHSTELLSDWAIMTPMGVINPRQTAALRAVRSQREELLAYLKEYKAREG